MNHSPQDVASALIRDAGKIVVLTGAGISAESGMPTFRAPQDGLWSKYRPEELATPGAFARDPELVWGWYRWRRELARRAEPNAAHRALARWQRESASDVCLVTQNVDGLHGRAGSDSLLELHGNIFRDRCSRSDKVLGMGGESDDKLPRCPDCGALARPDVVWFGESLDPAVLEKAFAASVDCDILLAVGTSGLVFPAAALPGYARSHGARFIEINTEETALSGDADFSIRGGAAVVLPQILGRIPGGAELP